MKFEQFCVRQKKVDILKCKIYPMAYWYGPPHFQNRKVIWLIRANQKAFTNHLSCNSFSLSVLAMRSWASWKDHLVDCRLSHLSIAIVMNGFSTSIGLALRQAGRQRQRSAVKEERSILKILLSLKHFAPKKHSGNESLAKTSKPNLNGLKILIFLLNQCYIWVYEISLRSVYSHICVFLCRVGAVLSMGGGSRAPLFITTVGFWPLLCS